MQKYKKRGIILFFKDIFYTLATTNN